VYAEWFAIACVLRAIQVHKRRDQTGEAVEHPWDEDTSEKPDKVVRHVIPEHTQPDGANSATDKGDYQSVDGIPHVSLETNRTGGAFWGMEGTYKGILCTKRNAWLIVPEPLAIVWILGNVAGRTRKPARMSQRKTHARALYQKETGLNNISVYFVCVIVLVLVPVVPDVKRLSGLMRR
jgi:hypothetical protein